MRRATLVVGTCAAVFLLLGVRAFWLEPASLRVVQHRVVIPTWPKACSHLRVAVLSDLHIGSPFNGLNHLKNIVELTNAAAPDLVLLPGDFVIQGVFGGKFVPPESTAHELANLRAPMGVYAVLGNHDWWLGAQRVQAAFESNLIPVLEDRSIVFTHAGCAINLVGISDFTEGPHNVSKALSSLSAALPTLVFTHNPDIFPALPPNVTLTIAGHTHGGQVDFPVAGRPVVPSRYGERYAIGHIEEAGRHMFVSSGIGTSILPVRFRVPPEISLLQITGGKIVQEPA